MPAPSLTTTRLRLRPWRDEDLGPFASINADPRVMRHFPATLSRAQSDQSAHRIRRILLEQDYGLWALERPGAGFIGYTGLAVPRFTAAFTPCVEIGWRLAYDQWGQGLATEAASAAMSYGFDQLGLAEIVSFNRAGQPALDRRDGAARHDANGGRRLPAPDLPAHHKLRPHVLYRRKNHRSSEPPQGG